MEEKGIIDIFWRGERRGFYVFLFFFRGVWVAGWEVIRGASEFMLGGIFFLEDGDLCGGVECH